MKRLVFLVGVAALGLAACSEAGREDGVSETIASRDTADAGAESAAIVGDVEDGGPRRSIPAAMPKIAYNYGMAFELEPAKIGRLMRTHATACEQQGPASCRIVGMDLSGRVEDERVRGTLTLAVAAGHARAVASLVEDEAADAGAVVASSTIASDEVSKTIVDTEARIRAREQLRDRLQDVLRTRKGSVKDLVAAERSVAEVNEEIDQARSWLAETKGRVAFSKLSIDYAPGAGTGASFAAPVKGALGSLGTILGNVVAALIVLLAIVGPLAGAAFGLRWVVRRLRPPAAMV